MNWQAEFQDALRTIEDINYFFNFNFPSTPYPLFIPKTFAQKIKNHGPGSPLWRQFLPHQEETKPSGLYDPIGDTRHFKGHQIIHRYQNRALFMPTTICPIICRYCFRKNELMKKDEIFNQNFLAAKEYLNTHQEINEIILSGGDPLILSNEKLKQIILDFSLIKNLQFIRFHSRTPIILPSRIDDEFIDLMKIASQKFKRAILVIHINHSDELDLKVITAIKKLTDQGIEVLSQTVLLKGVNDNTNTLLKLFNDLAMIKIKPYYLHHPDETLGAMHFHLPIETGRKIFHPLHHLLSGWALPQYMLDIPEGEGKIPVLNPEGFPFSGSLLNRHGEKIRLIPRQENSQEI